MNEHEQRLRARCGQSGLLPKLTERGGVRLFPRLDLAAGEFPGRRQVLIGRAACDKDAGVADDDRERDVEALLALCAQAGAPAAPGE